MLRNTKQQQFGIRGHIDIYTSSDGPLMGETEIKKIKYQNAYTAISKFSRLIVGTSTCQALISTNDINAIQVGIFTSFTIGTYASVQLSHCKIIFLQFSYIVLILFCCCFSKAFHESTHSLLNFSNAYALASKNVAYSAAVPSSSQVSYFFFSKRTLTTYANVLNHSHDRHVCSDVKLKNSTLWTHIGNV